MMYTQLQRFDEKDRMELPGSDAYKAYFHYLETVFRQVVLACSVNDSIKYEGALLKSFLAKLLNSIECLRMKYVFDPNFKMKIDESDSSYPNAYEFSTLVDDISLRNERLARIKSKEVLLREFIDTIYGRTEDITPIQLALATRTYYEYLGKSEKIFLPFTPGVFEYDSDRSTDERNSYTYTWGVFEPTLSIPMVYELIFESEKESFVGNEGSKTSQKLLQDLLFHSKGLNPLADIIRSIDISNSDIYPKEMRRLIVGPLYGRYSTSDSVLSQFVHDADADDMFALEVQSEFIRSVNEKKRTAKFSPTDTKPVYQEFDVSQTSFATMARKTTECKQLLFVPHEVGQQMFAHNIEELKEYMIVSLQKT